MIILRNGRASYARLTWMDNGLRIEHGNRRCLNFHPQTVEVILFEEFPELRDMHDGIGWNLEELYQLLTDAQDTALPEAVTLLLTQKDINLLSAAGLSVKYQ